MDNFKVLVEAKDPELFPIAMRLAFVNRPKMVATHFEVKDDGMLYLYYGGGTKHIPLPYKMDVKAATDFAWGWLQTDEAVVQKTYLPDGSCYQDSWRVETDNSSMWEGVLAVISKRWSLYSK